MQRISPFTIAEETLQNASMQRGQGGMTRTSAPLGPNMMDSGPASKVGMTDGAQQYFDQLRMGQSVQQNTISAASQAGANAVQGMRKQQLVADNQNYKANALLEQRKSEILSVGNNPATLAMGNMSPPDQEVFRSHIATGKAMSMGVNPDLAQNQIGEMRYG
jgi:hypothetical protein